MSDPTLLWIPPPPQLEPLPPPLPAAPHPHRPPPTMPPEDPEHKLEIDLAMAAAGLFLSLLLVLVLHWRPTNLLTHGGTAMLVGAAVNGGVYAYSSLFTESAVTLSVVISAEVHSVVYFGFLPPIIFEAGYSMRKRGFFDNLVPILFYAVPGTLIATCAAAILFYAIGNSGLVITNVSPGEALLFATLISPTDPVATLSVLRQVNAPPALRNCIFGEATLNDALSIVLFKVSAAEWHRVPSSGTEWHRVAPSGTEWH